MTQNKKKSRSFDIYGRTRVVGITGGIGSGKSVVMDILGSEFGAELIYSDLLAHDLMQPGGASYEKILEEFGDRVTGPDGFIDRERLSKEVFGNPARLGRLNAITHPAVIDEIFSRVAAASRSGKDLVAVEAALMLESGIADCFDSLWYVYADEETRIERLSAGRGYSPEKSRSVMKKQKSEEEFRAGCDTVIDNSGSLDQTRDQVRAGLERMGMIWS